MTAVKLVSDLLMLVLAVLAGPAGKEEFRVDLVHHSGRVETVLVRRADDGSLVLLSDKEGRFVENGYVRPVADQPGVYRLKLGSMTEQTIDLAATIDEFKLETVQTAANADLRVGDQGVIRLRRSGDTVYLTPQNGTITYASH